MHKAPGWSQLSKTNMGTLETKQPDLNTLGWVTSHDATWRAQPNEEATWEKMTNELPECAQGTWVVTT